MNGVSVYGFSNNVNTAANAISMGLLDGKQTAVPFFPGSNQSEQHLYVDCGLCSDRQGCFAENNDGVYTVKNTNE